MIRKILIAVTIDWEDYDDVSDELIIEDAFESLILKDGVQIEIVKTETKQAAIPPCPCLWKQESLFDRGNALHKVCGDNGNIKHNNMSLYYCGHCYKTVWRNSEKAWIKSYCEKTGKDVRLMRLKSNFTCTNRNSCDWKHTVYGLNLCMYSGYCAFQTPI